MWGRMQAGEELQAVMPTTTTARIMNKIIRSMSTAIELGFKMADSTEQPGSMAKPLVRIFENTLKTQGSTAKIYENMGSRVVRIGKMVVGNMVSMS